MKYVRVCILLLATIFPVLTHAEPTLYIKDQQHEKIFTRSELLKRADVTIFTTNEDPTKHGKTVTYTVVPAAALFAGFNIPQDAAIEFHATDGFAAEINKQQLLNTNSKDALAYIAIEKPDEQWPMVNPATNLSAGPFYLIWKDAKKSNIQQEQWVLMLAGFTIEESFEKQYPHVVPAKSLSPDDPVVQGFKLFKSNCFTCHTINRQGKGTIGPDLNVPHNVTEYMREPFMKIFIRNPQNLRHYPHDKMNAFPPSAISDADLDKIISYLKYMKNHKVDK